MFGGDSGGGSSTYPDIARMSITPTPRSSSKSNHTRAQSESFLQFPDESLLLLDDPEIDLSPMLPPTSPPELNNPNPNPSYTRHHRSLSVDDDFFDDLGFSYPGMMEGEGKLPDGDVDCPGGGVRAHRRRHSFSMDGSVHGLSGVESDMDGVKKAMAPEKLAHLALVDPKKAKRILANRQSAARSKERKIWYTSELERKVQTLQTEATTLSAQVTLLQRDANGLTSENKELKLRLQAMEQQAHLKEALNETLKNEVYRLRMETGQIPPSNGHAFINRSPLQYSSQTSSHFYGGHQTQQNHPQSQQPRSSSNSSNQIPNRSVQSSFMDYSN